MPDQDLMRRPLAEPAAIAEYLGIQERSLAMQRYRDQPPGNLGFRVGGVIRYRWEDIDAYIEASREVGS